MIYRDGKPTIYREEIFKIDVYGGAGQGITADRKIRIWTPYVGTLEVQNEITDFVSTNRHQDDVDLAEMILEKWNINAIEILDIEGAGIVFYADWP